LALFHERSAKVIFMDPNSIPGTLQGLLSMVDVAKGGEGSRAAASQKLRTPASFPTEVDFPRLD
jgi:hypothetical protein